MSQNPFNLDLAIDELRTVQPGSNGIEKATIQMQSKVLETLHRTGGNPMKTRIVRISLATLAAGAIAIAALMIPRSSYASGIVKVAKAFQDAAKYHIRSFWTVDGKQRLNAETWIDGSGMKTRMYDENGKPLPSGDLEMRSSGNGGTGSQSTIKLKAGDSATLKAGTAHEMREIEVNASHAGAAPSDQDVTEALKGIDRSDPKFDEKAKAALKARFGDNANVEVRVDNREGPKSDDHGVPIPTMKTVIDTRGPNVSGHYASVQYSVESLRKLLKDPANWAVEPAQTLDGKIVDRYKSKTTNMELFVDPQTSLPVRLHATITENGKTVETNDYYDYSSITPQTK